MPRKVKESNSSLGKQLAKLHRKKQPMARQPDEPMGGYKVHTVFDVEQKAPLISVLEQNSLEEFVQLAQLSSKNFEAERASQVVFADSHVVHGRADDPKNSVAMVNVFLNSDNPNQAQQVLGDYVPLTIPRRPVWDRNMTGLEIENQENIAFLEWRRDIANIEQNNIALAITPFEKNVGIWRQLWRVIEKCDLLLQIVDARNPYFFYSQDLEKYITEMSCKGENGPKEFILLVNKADYLSEDLIAHWNKYFKEKGIQHIFFSALEEQAKIDNGELDESDPEVESEKEDEPEQLAVVDMEELKQIEETLGGFKNELERGALADKEAEKRKRKLDATLDDDLQVSTTQVFTRSALLTILKRKSRSMREEEDSDDRLMVGTIGYPNVGKSSVINVLMGVKKVGVAALPGKTKHLQTLILNPEVELCDCPGLVFPSFANSKAEMMCCGVLSIDQMREHISPIQLVLSRISKEVLEAFYKVFLPPQDSHKYTTATFLQVLASKKGWRTGSGNPAEIKASKWVMKDYTSGRLLHCQIRPDFDPAKHEVCQQNGFNLTLAPIDEADEDEEVKEAAAVEDADTQNSSQAAKDVVAPTPGSSAYEAVEDDFDNQFFGKKQKKFKLNKGEKRALKFAVKKGANIDEVDDLKSFLGSKIKQSQMTHNTPLPARGPIVAPAKKPVPIKSNTYKDLEDYTSD